jgi:hypothetical protein
MTVLSSLKRNKGRAAAFGVALVASLALVLSLSSAASAYVLTDSDQYQVNDAPPNGVYVNIYTTPTAEIEVLNNAPTGSALPGGFTGCGGDEGCTMEQLRDYADTFPDTIWGSFASTFWVEALDPSEQGDFAEALANAGQTDNGEPRCLDLTIRDYGYFDYNWSWRPLSDGNCETGQPF